MKDTIEIIKVFTGETGADNRYALAINGAVIKTDANLREVSIALEQWEAAHGK